MKILKCTVCDRKQKEGKYCLDCGKPLKEVINKEICFKPIKSNKSCDKIKKDIRCWLARIGVQQSDIQIFSGDGAEIQYVLSGREYKFKSVLQDNKTNNLAAVEQFLHYRVLGIERGIETKEQAFAGYEALPQTSVFDDYFSGCKTEEECKARFNDLSKKYHPDVNNGEDTLFIKLKKQYDEKLLELKQWPK